MLKLLKLNDTTRMMTHRSLMRFTVEPNKPVELPIGWDKLDRNMAMDLELEWCTPKGTVAPLFRVELIDDVDQDSNSVFYRTLDSETDSTIKSHMTTLRGKRSKKALLKFSTETTAVSVVLKLPRVLFGITDGSTAMRTGRSSAPSVGSARMEGNV